MLSLLGRVGSMQPHRESTTIEIELYSDKNAYDQLTEELREEYDIPTRALLEACDTTRRSLLYDYVGDSDE